MSKSKKETIFWTWNRGFSLRKFVLVTSTACYATFGIMLIIFSLQLRIDLSDPLKPADQIVDDWNTVPFVDLTVVRGDEECPAGTDLVMWKPWLGTVPYCVCNRVHNWTHKRGACLSDTSAINWSFDSYYCAEMEA